MYAAVANVRKPRQKSSRWLLVDFETNDQAEEFKKILQEKKEIAKIKVKVNKLSIKEHDPSEKPENERQQFVNSLTKQSFQSKTLEKYSNKLLVTNLPENVTKNEVSELFPHSLSLDLKHSPKLRAIVTYSSAKEAMAARMNVRPIIDGQKIRVILLLLDDGSHKRKASETEKTSSPSEEAKVIKVVSKVQKSKKKEPHKLVRPLRYFENKVEWIGIVGSKYFHGVKKKVIFIANLWQQLVSCDICHCATLSSLSRDCKTGTSVHATGCDSKSWD